MNRIAYFIFFVLAGCNSVVNPDLLPDAKEIVMEFVKYYQEGEYEKLNSLYGEEFWAVIPKKTWAQILPNIRSELGALKKCELLNWNQSSTISTARKNGDYVTLYYACNHDKYDSSMIFTVFTPFSGGDSKIVGQNISSIGLLLE